MLAVPLGLASAIFLSELAPRKSLDFISFLIDLLAAVPSVIYGVLGIFLLEPVMRTTIAVPESYAGFFSYIGAYFTGPVMDLDF